MLGYPFSDGVDIDLPVDFLNQFADTVNEVIKGILPNARLTNSWQDNNIEVYIRPVTMVV